MQLFTKTSREQPVNRKPRILAPKAMFREQPVNSKTFSYTCRYTHRYAQNSFCALKGGRLRETNCLRLIRTTVLVTAVNLVSAVIGVKTERVSGWPPGLQAA